MRLKNLAQGNNWVVTTQEKADLIEQLRWELRHLRETRHHRAVVGLSEEQLLNLIILIDPNGTCPV